MDTLEELKSITADINDEKARMYNYREYVKALDKVLDIIDIHQERIKRNLSQNK